MVRSTPTLTPIGARVHYHHGEVLPALCMPGNVLQFSLSQSNFFSPFSVWLSITTRRLTVSLDKAVCVWATELGSFLCWAYGLVQERRNMGNFASHVCP